MADVRNKIYVCQTQGLHNEIESAPEEVDNIGTSIGNVNTGDRNDEDQEIESGEICKADRAFAEEELGKDSLEICTKEVATDVKETDVGNVSNKSEEDQTGPVKPKARKRPAKCSPRKRKGAGKRRRNPSNSAEEKPGDEKGAGKRTRNPGKSLEEESEETKDVEEGSNEQRRKLRKRVTAVSYCEDSITVIKPFGRERVECPHCDKEFEKRYLKLHLLKHSGDRPHICDICKKSFISRYNVKLHKERCHGAKKMFDCDICRRTFSSKHAATEHRRTHTGEKPYRCKTCLREFSHMSAWTSHERTHNPNLSRVFQCEQCNKMFKHKRSLQKHTESVHQGIRKAHAYLCSTCGQSYDSHSKLKVHQYRHTGERPFSCQDCSKTFMTKDVLRNHMLIHQDVKPFQCESCGMRFRQAITFKRHRSVHTGIKPFKCKICSKQFIHRVYMMKHECYKSRRGREKNKTAPDAGDPAGKDKNQGSIPQLPKSTDTTHD